MDISINGNGQGPSKNNWLDNGTDDGSIENMVDNAMVSKQHGNPVSYQATRALLSSSVWGTT